MAAKKAIASRNTPADTPSSAVSSNSPFKNCTYVPATPAMGPKKQTNCQIFPMAFYYIFHDIILLFANAGNRANKSHLSIFCVPNQPLSAPKWQSGSSITFEVDTAQNNRKLWKHEFATQSSMRKDSNVRAVTRTTKCNDHMYTSFCSILILMYHKDGKFANIKSERFC